MTPGPAAPSLLAVVLQGAAFAPAMTGLALAEDRAVVEVARYLHTKSSSCWTIPAAAPAGRTVRIRIELDRDGALVSEPVVIEPPPEPAVMALIEGARRAVIRCAPYDGVKRYAALYPHWREIIVNFRRED